MTTITIRQLEGKGANESPNASLSFDEIGGEYPITIKNPFTEDEEKRLEWYFEEYLLFPFGEDTKFQEAKDSINRYGHALFEQIFENRIAYAQYYCFYRQHGVENLHFEIKGKPGFFHQLHWEALKDPQWNTPIVLEATMVRSTFQTCINPARSQKSPTLNILIVVARPLRNDICYRILSKPLVESLRKAKIYVKIDVVRPGTYEALLSKLDSHSPGYYHVIHFDLHGELATYQQLKERAPAGDILFQNRFDRGDLPNFEGQRAFLFFESANPGQADPAEAKEIADLLSRYSICIAVLNACQSAKITVDTEASVGSRLMEAGVQMVIAMGYSVTRTAVALMMTEFYRKLFDGRSPNRALCHGRKVLKYNKLRQFQCDQKLDLEDWMLPVVYQNRREPAESSLVLREFTREEEQKYWQNQSKRYDAPNTRYGSFVGRDLDILEVERRLTATIEGRRCNFLLIHGKPGSGKTTFMKHLMEWWQATNFIIQPFYFSYDNNECNVDQIIDSLAKGLLSVEAIEGYTRLTPPERREKIVRELQSNGHLLVLDNLEYLNFNPEKRNDLIVLLTKLLGGNTIVLMGSSELNNWLIEGVGAPLKPRDAYDLPGLDYEAATILAEIVLSEHVYDIETRGKYRNSEEFVQLMKLLDGYPQPIQLVIANLTDRTPEELLTILNNDTMNYNIQDRKKRIMQFLEYFENELAPKNANIQNILTTANSEIMSEVEEPSERQMPIANMPDDKLMVHLGKEILEEPTEIENLVSKLRNIQNRGRVVSLDRWRMI